MRFLVLGASGMAGHAISIYLSERGHEVTGLDVRGVPWVPCVVGDARDEALLRETIAGGYDVVCNCVGVLNAACDENPQLAEALNARLPHVLASITEGTPTRVFHMSTDCVFAGNTGPYTEDSVPDGTSRYDRTKAAGELRDAKNLTFRNSIVGPDPNPKGIGLLNWFMSQEGEVRGYTGAVWTGLTTLELAKAMEHEATEEASGLVNMVPGSITKHDLLLLFNEHMRRGKVRVVPDGTVRLDKTLVRTNFGPTFTPGPYERQVREMAEWVREHRRLYPHYRMGE